MKDWEQWLERAWINREPFRSVTPWTFLLWYVLALTLASWIMVGLDALFC